MSEPFQNAASRRARLMESCAPALVVVRGAGPDGLNPNFFYLTGMTEPAGILVLSAAGLRVGTGAAAPGPDYYRGTMLHQVLFLPSGSPLDETWGTGPRVSYEHTHAEGVGVDAVLPRSEFETRLAGWLQETGRLAYVRPAAPTFAGPDADAAFVDTIRSRFLGLAIEDATPVVGEMRARKDAFEIEAIRRAAEVTAAGFDRVCDVLRPGVLEHELEAELAAAYRRAGAGHAFDPIVGAGRNALKLHYRDNVARVADGDLVLVDSGARLDGYGADVTRTFPASGSFSPRQAALYGVVLAAWQAAVDAVRPGIRLGDLHSIAWQSIEAAGHGAAFIHGLTHHLGIETHDTGDKQAPLAAGAVITIEPGIYLADEGVGIRIEDDVLVTTDGCEVLTAAIPRTIEEIESRMTRS
jgi:Xaa-Pro aminopeptidase